MLHHLFFLFLIMLAVALDAYSDARIDLTGKRSHIAEISMIVVFFLIFFLRDFYYIGFINIAASYLALRVGLFGYIYNKTRGDLPDFFVGTTDPIFDKIMNKVPSSVITSISIVSVFLGVVSIYFDFALAFFGVYL